MPKIKKTILSTETMDIELVPVFCEVSGKQLCWRTNIDFDEIFSPAYISFKYVNEQGETTQDAIGIEMF